MPAFAPGETTQEEEILILWLVEIRSKQEEEHGRSTSRCTGRASNSSLTCEDQRSGPIQQPSQNNPRCHWPTAVSARIRHRRSHEVCPAREAQMRVLAHLGILQKPEENKKSSWIQQNSKAKFHPIPPNTQLHHPSLRRIGSILIVAWDQFTVSRNPSFTRHERWSAAAGVG